MATTLCTFAALAAVADTCSNLYLISAFLGGRAMDRSDTNPTKRSIEPPLRAALEQLAAALRWYLQAKQKHYAAMQETHRQRSLSRGETASTAGGDAEPGESAALRAARVHMTSCSMARDAAECEVFRALEAIAEDSTHEPSDNIDFQIHAYFQLADAVRRWRDNQATALMRFEEAHRLSLDPIAATAFCNADWDACFDAHRDAVRWLDTIDRIGARP